MREPENILAVGNLRPDYMGFIFYPKSPRYVGEHFEIPAGLPASVSRVGVFVNAETQEMLSVSKRLSLQYLQLHGSESVEQVRALRDAGMKIIKVFSVDGQFDFTKLYPYESYVDYFLFDTKGKYHGGNAMAFDWEILKGYNQKIPFFLSGGITPENVNKIETLAGMNLHALDINSGVEVQPALKDPAKVRQVQQFVNEMKILN